MATEPIYPVLPGLSWNIERNIGFKSRIQRSVSGRRSALLDQPFPIRMWSLSYEVLRDQSDRRGPGLGIRLNEMTTLQGFFLQCQGAFGHFLFEDPIDRARYAEPLGSGDGTTTQFQLVRTLGGAVEPIYAPNVVAHVYLSGIIQSTGAYSVNTATGIVTFTAAPALNAPITADFSYRWRCAFMEDQMSFKNFLYQLYSADGIKFESLLP